MDDIMNLMRIVKEKFDLDKVYLTIDTDESGWVFLGKEKGKDEQIIFETITDCHEKLIRKIG